VYKSFDMSEIVNLRHARKLRERAKAASQAAENRARFGARKVDKDLEAARQAQAERRIDGHRRENGGDADT
jgi:hypothetical protein